MAYEHLVQTGQLYDHLITELWRAGVNMPQDILKRRFLCDVLGLAWAEAHHEAGKWEHVIGPAVEDALARVLGDPTTCPHGNPIPGSAYQALTTQTLASVGVGAELSFAATLAVNTVEAMEDQLEMPSFAPTNSAISNAD